ncbi:MAG: LacI family DNA-binding transcriptional regulator [Clostridia bacterium]|nr:LacI family DNA-binding transcriptional regulator [Clostridia bacterium]
MTLSKLAQLAHASVSTVSKAFSGKGDISDATREHIFAVAKEHGCFQQFYHMPYDRPVVAVVIPEATSQTYLRYVEALRKELEKNEYTMLLSISNFDPQMLQELARYYFEHSKVDGLILLGGSAQLPPNCPTVMICVGKQEDADVRIYTDLRPGLTQALRHLHHLGHRRIAYVGEPLIESKRLLMEEEMEKLGLSPCPSHMVCSLQRFEEAGRDGVRKIQSDSAPKPTAIIGGYGYIAAGIIDELGKLGIRIPEDVSVVSMNDDELHRFPALQISHIHIDIEEECRQMVQLLNHRIGAKSPNAPYIREIPSLFIAGNTVAPPPEADRP